MADFFAHIANCLIGGTQFERDGSHTLRLDIQNKQIEVIQRPELFQNINLRDSFHGKQVKTTKVIVFNVGEDELENVRSMIYSLCNILSFITCSQVVFYGQEYPKNTSFWAVIGKTNIYRNIIEIKDGRIVQEFIQTVWENFTSVKKVRKLDMIFDYIHNANYPGSTVESKLIFSFVTLESLKHTYAKSKGIPFKNKHFRKPNNKSYSFIELLECMFQEVGITFRNKKNIKNLRDEIIHSGISQFDFNYNYNVFNDIQNLIRQYLIKLLGYQKNFKSL